jgi:hypothetical protein
VNFGLLSPAERAGLVAGFAGWLNSLTGPVQILINADRIDLAPLINQLAEQAPSLPDPALEEAAVEHARWLAELAATRDLLRRRVLLILRESAGPGGRQTAAARVLRRAEEAARALAGCEITIHPLDGAAAAAVLSSTAAPYAPPHPAGAHAAAPEAVITAWPGEPAQDQEGGDVSWPD